MSEPTTTPATTAAGTDNVAIVQRFLFALRDTDFDAADALLDDDLVYENVGLPTIHGRRRAMSLFRKMEGRGGFDVVIHRSAADGATVLNERTDVLIAGPVRVQFWVCGVFEVHHGRITLWRDYFDSLNFTKAVVRGLAGAVVPALRPQL
ncbi:nuclear transport factor 2 family protein [Mycobacterium sp. MYCO198283]|uniref:limonene-1,2-epoxide hydrolase family protein n=1 Tax=Mycobacterium sp. MYCO198283 TaxID=2883505 RepID=UPI001E648634|nr:limonene-1,2-epoxide hydrolase family protein [Mycobacterium sp. MYCO198283]MCG5433848.1 nuclear transport factor 2 family protein [Mycobacterium sp. MYCO198283]